MNYEYHELANLFPLMDESQYSDLVADIKENGLIESIILYEGKILDGRNRYNACNDAGVEPSFVEYEGEDALSYVISLNLNRRHLNESQRAMIGARLANMKHGGDRKNQESNWSFDVSNKDASEKLNVGLGSIKRAKQVQKEGIEDLQKSVEAGKVSVSAASDIATLDKAEQEVVVAKGEDEILKMAKEIRAKKSEVRKSERIADIIKQTEDIKNLDINFDKSYSCIVIDPPWGYGTEYDPNGRRAANPYPEMTLEQIKDIKLPATNDCVLWLWTTHKFMRHSFDIIDTWGFRDVSILTWKKDRIGLGSWLRSQSEFCIMCVKGSPVVNLSNQSTIIEGKLREHSRKPDAFYSMVDSLCVGTKLDYFSREQRNDWDTFGNDESKF
jgi:N6-adenosine-specific RNA methylase IME4